MTSKTLDRNAFGRTLQVLYISIYLVIFLVSSFAVYQSYTSYKSISQQNKNLARVLAGGKNMEIFKNDAEANGYTQYEIVDYLEKLYNVDLPYSLEKQDPYGSFKWSLVIIGAAMLIVELIALAGLYIFGYRANTLLISFLMHYYDQSNART